MLVFLVFASKLGLYTAALTGVGLLLHGAAAITTSRRWFLILGLGLVVAIAARLTLLNEQLGGGLGAAFSPETFSWIWPANRLQAFAFVGGAGLMALSAIARTGFLKLPAAIVIASGFALAGHTQGLDMPGLAPWLAGLHALIVGFWIIAPFTLWPRTDLPEATIVARMERFSQIAVWSVPLIFVTGVWLALRLTGSPTALLTSPYGQLLLAKLVLASLALAIGAWNKFRVTSMLAQNPARGLISLKRALGADIVLFASLLTLIAAATTFTGPGAA